MRLSTALEFEAASDPDDVVDESGKPVAREAATVDVLRTREDAAGAAASVFDTFTVKPPDHGEVSTTVIVRPAAGRDWLVDGAGKKATP